MIDSKTGFDSEKMSEIIHMLAESNIGEGKRWEAIIKKIRKGEKISSGESEYYSRLTRIYKNLGVTRSRIYHTRLSEHDEKPPCSLCKSNSEYYCNMNDQYFCTMHVVGHDPNEI